MVEISFHFHLGFHAESNFMNWEHIFKSNYGKEKKFPQFGNYFFFSFFFSLFFFSILLNKFLFDLFYSDVTDATAPRATSHIFALQNFLFIALIRSLFFFFCCCCSAIYCDVHVAIYTACYALYVRKMLYRHKYWLFRYKRMHACISRGSFVLSTMSLIAGCANYVFNYVESYAHYANKDRKLVLSLKVLDSF